MIKQALKKLVGEKIWQTLRYRLRHIVKKMGKAEIYNFQTNLVIQRVVTDRSLNIDIGCHRGYVLDMLLKQAPAASYVAVEPLPEMFAYLQAHYGLRPNVRLVNAALSESAGSVTFFHVVSSPEYSSLRARPEYGGVEEQTTKITVQTVRLDDLIDPTATVNFIKVDVEGAELQVFAGGVETIRRSRPVIVFEHGLGGADHFGTKPEHIYDVLCGQCGLRITLMENWLAKRSPFSREEFCEHFNHGRDFYYLAYP